MSHCCDDMRFNIESICDMHPDRFDCVDCLMGNYIFGSLLLALLLLPTLANAARPFYRGSQAGDGSFVPSGKLYSGNLWNAGGSNIMNNDGIGIGLAATYRREPRQEGDSGYSPIRPITSTIPDTTANTIQARSQKTASWDDILDARKAMRSAYRVLADVFLGLAVVVFVIGIAKIIRLIRSRHKRRDHA